jgi:nicotinate-nucleotide adenylyltransferase
MTRRIVLFGGSFDPIHLGHLITARAVAEHFGFETITFLPAGTAPHKAAGPAAAPAEDRLEMVRRAIAGEDRFEVSDLEIRGPQPSYTIQTLEALRERYGLGVELCWIVGADMLADLPTWHRADEVVDAARIITACRQPYTGQMDAILGRLSVRFTAEQMARLSAGLAPTPQIDISSSDIRRRAGAGRPITYLTHDNVVAYICDHHLYGPDKS